MNLKQLKKVSVITLAFIFFATGCSANSAPKEKDAKPNKQIPELSMEQKDNINNALSVLGIADENITIIIKDIKTGETLFTQGDENKSIAPGSAIKPISAAMLLDTGSVELQSMVDDAPYIIDKEKMWCSNLEGHGMLTFENAFINKCSPALQKKINEMSIDAFSSYMKDFGFSLSASDTKISDADMANMSVGRQLNVTPLQLINAYRIIGNGGVVQNDDGEEIQVIQPQTAATITSLMSKLVDKNEFEKVKSDRFEIAGTSGSHWYSEDFQEIQYTFAGFAPASQPEICLVISVYGSNMNNAAVAGPVKQIFETIL